jgi:hypothetical protein
MPEDKVVRFPGASAATTISDALEPHRQPNLFGHTDENRGKIVFLDIRWLAEEMLLTLLTRNAVTALVDLRPRPVFDRPRFRHRDVVHYLHERNVLYLEYAMLARGVRDSASQFRHKPEGAEEKISALLGRGLTVCVYDEASKTAGWLEEIRYVLRHAPDYLAEMHPRALIGAPDWSPGTTRHT